MEPPSRKPVGLAGPEAGCPEKFVACFTVDDALALEANVRRSQEWEEEAWLRCGPLPDAGLPDASR